MALKKIIDVEGESFINTNFGAVKTGFKKTTFASICKVISINGSKVDLKVNVLFSGDGTSFERTYSFEPSVLEGSPNFIKQSYLFLKTLPEFTGAEDC